MSAPLPKKVLVFGATGVIGRYIIEEIVKARDSFDKIGLFTSHETVEKKSDEINGWKEKGVEVFVGDVTDREDILKAYAGYDTIISALGRAAIHTQVPLLALADDPSSPITTFFPSEYGTDIAFSPSSATEKPHQQKLAVRAFVRDHVTKLNVTYLVTGPYPELFFAPSRNDTRGGSWDAKSCEATILGEGAERVSFCSMRDVGRCVVGALKRPFVSSLSTSPRILKVNSFTITSNDALAEFEAQTGRKWDVKYTSLDALRRLEDSAWREGWPNATPLTLRRIWTEGGTLYEKRDNGMIGMEEGCETLADVVRRAVEKAGV